MSCFQKKYYYFHFFSISISINLVIFISLIIYYYISRHNYVWFNSKILSIEKIINDNYENHKLYNAFLSYLYYNALNFSYYELLKNATRDKCPEDLKQCGILDTYGNKLCLYKEYDCPVNEIIIDSSEKEENYIMKGYKSVYYHAIRFFNNCLLYYTNTKTDNKVISSFIYYDFTPKLIDSHNFVFDKDAYEKKFEYRVNNPYNKTNNENITYGNNLENITYVNYTGNIKINKINEISYNNNENARFLALTKKIEGKEDEVGFWYDVPETKSKLLQTPSLQEYISSKINKSEDDENYIKIYNKLYIKNFVGFENTEEMDKLKNIDFTIYRNIFPDDSGFFLIIFFTILLLFFFLFYLKKIYDDENDGDNNTCKYYEHFIILCGMAIYTFSFLYFIIYLIKSFYRLKKYSKLSTLKNIKCDKLIKDFIDEFIKTINKKIIFVKVLILLFIYSLIFYIISIIFYSKIIIKEVKNKEKEKKMSSNNIINIENNIHEYNNVKNNEEEKIIKYQDNNINYEGEKCIRYDDKNLIINNKENSHDTKNENKTSKIKREIINTKSSERIKLKKSKKKYNKIYLDKKPLFSIIYK